jgi:hypothetical protein
MTIANNGQLVRIDFLNSASPGLTRAVLSLVDDGNTGWPPRQLYYNDLVSDPTVGPKYRSATSTRWTDVNHTAAWCLMDKGNIQFQNLTVHQVPINSRFELTVG